MNRTANLILMLTALIPASAASQVCVKQISVPDYPTIAVAAQWQGIVDLRITVGPEGKVVSVDGGGAHPALVDHTKDNIQEWIFCDPKKNGSAHVRLKYDYRIEGAPVYPVPPAKVVIDLGTGTIVITSAPMEPQP